RLRGRPQQLGKGLKLSDTTANEVVTDAAGRVVQAAGEIYVDEVLAVVGDVDFETGNIESPVNVEIRGAVRAKFSVRTDANVTVNGTIEAADVWADGDVTCLKGIVGNQCAGRVHARGVVTARFVNDANVEADGGVRIARSAVNSRIHTIGDLLIENGSIISGQTYAREGIVARTLGSDAGVSTQIAIGRDPHDLATIRKLEQDAEQCRTTAQQIRDKVMPLMAQAKRLTAEQRERATELLCRADEIETRIDDLQAQRDQLWESSAPRGKPSVKLVRECYPGVRISIGLREARIKTHIAGPIRFEERQVNGPTELVVVNERTGSVTVVPTYELDIEQFMQTDKQTGVEPDEPAAN
ncbi:MAG: DUF342 domain-containing protein, partial [Phycisphaerae bacterium]|nr:DUF342 domain-containing protein [Phycisphaerae bacterium]